MSNENCTLTQQDVKELFSYCENTGLLTRRKTIHYNAKEGDVINNKSALGYVRVNVNGKSYTAHRLIWLYVYGSFPKNEIDHINGIRNDNRIVNLRDVTHDVNLNNLRIDKRNKYGCKGVTFHKASKKFCVNFNRFGIRHYVGLFDTLELAIAAYESKFLSINQKETP